MTTNRIITAEVNQNLYWDAAGPVLSMASFWKLILLLPVGQRMYLFHILVSMSVLPAAWGSSEVLIIIIQIMCMESSVAINSHLDVNCVEQWHYYFLSVFWCRILGGILCPLAIATCYDLSAWYCDRKLKSKERQVVLGALKNGISLPNHLFVQIKNQG